MYSTKVLKTLLVPAAMLVAEDKNQSQDSSTICRPSELPIYVSEQPPILTEPQQQLEPRIPNFLEEGFGTVREHVTKVYTEIKAYQRVGLDYVAQSKDNADWLLKYLRQENNTTPKAGAIAIGGLTGLIFGLRGRFFKRTVYTATGALGMAAVCYPKEASEYSQLAIAETKKYATIAYNFAYGVKKDDPPLELPSLPKIPSSLSEAWDSVTKSASSLVSGGDTGKVTNVTGTLSELTEEDAINIITKAHDESTSRSCHCPVGSCLGNHEENESV